MAEQRGSIHSRSATYRLLVTVSGQDLPHTPATGHDYRRTRAQVAEAVRLAAANGPVKAVRLESRRNGNGHGAAPHRQIKPVSAAGEPALTEWVTLEAWDEAVIRRILEQASGRPESGSQPGEPPLLKSRGTPERPAPDRDQSFGSSEGQSGGDEGMRGIGDEGPRGQGAEGSRGAGTQTPRDRGVEGLEEGIEGMRKLADDGAPAAPLSPHHPITLSPPPGAPSRPAAPPPSPTVAGPERRRLATPRAGRRRLRPPPRSPHKPVRRHLLATAVLLAATWLLIALFQTNGHPLSLFAPSWLGSQPVADALPFDGPAARHADTPRSSPPATRPTSRPADGR